MFLILALDSLGWILKIYVRICGLLILTLVNQGFIGIIKGNRSDLVLGRCTGVGCVNLVNLAIILNGVLGVSLFIWFSFSPPSP